MFGIDFDKIFDLKIDKSYSSFLNNTKKLALFKEALISTIETDYRKLDEQREYDDISSVIKTNTVYTPDASNNSIFTKGTGTPKIANYKHLLTVKAKYIQDTYWNVVGAKNNYPNATTIIINTARNNLRSGEYLQISGLVGIPIINGFRYIRRLNNTHFDLYSDKDLTVPIVMTVPQQSYTSGGDILRVWYKYATQYYSDRKTGIYGKPTVEKPKWEISENKLIMYPLDEVCKEITIDYITDNLVLIDPTDTTIDLELTYPTNFLYTVAKEAARLFAESIKDAELWQTSTIELAEEK